MILDARVTPRASRDAIESDGKRLIAWVTAAPDGGKANAAVEALLAKRLGVAKRDVAIVSGRKSRDKRIRIDGMSAAAVFECLDSG